MMPLRPMSSEMLAAIRSRLFRPCLLFEGSFRDGTLNLWSGKHDLSWSGKTWTGRGVLLGFSGTTEESGIVASGWSVSFSGIPTESGDLALNQVVQGRPGKVYLGARDEAGSLIPDPVLLAYGRMDVPTLLETGETCTVTVTFESRFIDLKRTREFRWTDQHQQLLHPGDLGCAFVTAIQDRDFKWGGS